MGLVTCPDCGKEVSDRAVACPNCGAPLRTDTRPQAAAAKVQEVVVVDPSYYAGHEAGRGCAMLLTSTPMAFVVFIGAWILGSMVLAVRTGLYVEGEDPALWVGFVILVLPFILAYVLRRPIRRYIPVVMGSGLLIVLALFFVFAVYMTISMFYGLFFDWDSAW